MRYSKSMFPCSFFIDIASHDIDLDGCLNRDELIHAFESMKLPFSTADYYEITKLIPQTDKGYPDSLIWSHCVDYIR